MALLGPNGRPISTANYKKADPPKLGPAFGNWAGRDAVYNQLPGGAMMSFDLSKLTLADFRAMKEHPQINASLAVLTFMMHQLDWHVECSDRKIAQKIEDNLRIVWTRLIRALSQAYWAGYSPCVLEFENDVDGRAIVLTKIKDLLPEEASVNWKEVPGWAPPGSIPPKMKVYDGIRQMGARWPIPAESTLWYPLLMENGNYYGRKLLKPAFSSWYFSMLIHLFANRYYERFGEPTPVGRAPFDETVDTNEGTLTGKEAMDLILMNLRNRGVVTLPSDRDPVTKEFDYEIGYLESQMRGADFERYLGRLDEEMSLGIFTPVLLFRTADVGSFNLGVQHMQLFMYMLNALAGDLKEYIDRYIVERLKAINFTPNAPRAEWKFRKLGKENVETVRALLTELVRGGKVMPDLDQLGEIAGLDMKTVRQVTAPTDQPDPNADGGDPEADTRGPRNRGTDDKGPRTAGQPRATGRQISNRIRGQVENAWKAKTFGPTFTPDLGYRKRMVESLVMEGASEHQAAVLADQFFGRVQRWLDVTVPLGMEEFAGPADFMSMFDRVVDDSIDAIAEEVNAA